MALAALTLNSFVAFSAVAPRRTTQSDLDMPIAVDPSFRSPSRLVLG